MDKITKNIAGFLNCGNCSMNWTELHTERWNHAGGKLEYHKRSWLLFKFIDLDLPEPVSDNE